MIKHETIRVDGTVIYCDGKGCGARGPQVASADDAQTVTEEAEAKGWVTGDEGDFCPACAKRLRL